MFLTSSTTVSTITGAAGDIFTEAISWVTDVADTIGSTPILLVFVLLPLVGLGVGLFARLIHTRG